MTAAVYFLFTKIFLYYFLFAMFQELIDELD
jgi:hypothetical protein